VSLIKQAALLNMLECYVAVKHLIAAQLNANAARPLIFKGTVYVPGLMESKAHWNEITENIC